MQKGRQLAKDRCLTLWVNHHGPSSGGLEDAMHHFVIVVEQEDGHPAHSNTHRAV